MDCHSDSQATMFCRRQTRYLAIKMTKKLMGKYFHSRIKLPNRNTHKMPKINIRSSCWYKNKLWVSVRTPSPHKVQFVLTHWQYTSKTSPLRLWIVMSASYDTQWRLRQDTGQKSSPRSQSCHSLAMSRDGARNTTGINDNQRWKTYRPLYNNTQSPSTKLTVFAIIERNSLFTSHSKRANM